MLVNGKWLVDIASPAKTFTTTRKHICSKVLHRRRDNRNIWHNLIIAYEWNPRCHISEAVTNIITQIVQ